jgi:hypothetical protein
MNRKSVLLLAGVVGIQLFLSARVFTPAPHTGGDNAGYVALAHSILDRGAYLELWTPGEPQHTKYPPVFPLLLAGAMALGVKGWAGLKAVPFVSTLLVGALSFLWIRGRKGDAVAASVALLVVLADAVLYYSRWILSDPTFLAFTLGALWTLEKGEKEETDNPGLWLLAGFVLVLLAYFTRSAGLPLVVATVLWLILRRGWGGLAIFSAAFLGSAGLWWWRGLEAGGSSYAAEFWLLDPYRPELGRVGVTGLLGRMWGNLLAYVTNFIPEGIVGLEGSLLPILGVGLTSLALLGWARSFRKGPGLGELFLPLYLGLMLLWPEVWSGDRFALPLFPLLLFYAVSALLWVFQGLKPALRTAILAGGFLLVAVPSLESWAEEAEAAGTCRAMSKGGDPWSCHGPNVQGYVQMAGWAGANLPVGSVVVARKPRIFFVQSSVKALSLPLTTDPDEFLGLAREGGSRYLMVDRWDGLTAYYVPPILRARPGSFCYVTGLESGGQVAVQLLGIRSQGEVGGGEEGTLPRCPPEMIMSRPWPREPVGPGEIPLLVWGHRTR